MAIFLILRVYTISSHNSGTKRLKSDSQAKIIEEFKKAIESEQILKWIAFAERLLRLYKNGRETTLNGEDIVYEILNRVTDNNRTFKHDLNIDQFMIMTIRSVIDGEYKKSKRMVYDGDIENSEEGNLHSVFDENGDGNDKRADTILEGKDILNLWLESCEDDEDAQLVILEIAGGNDKNQKIAESLGIPVSDVTNIKKRIKRRIDRKLLNS